MFCTPSNILVVGPSGSGKTVFVSELLKEPHRYFRPVPKRVHYCYGAMQPLLQTLRDDYKVGLHEGLPTMTDLTRWFGNDGGILVLDDLMAEGGNDKQVLDLFTKHSHHRNITVIYLCQDMFPRKKYAKTINRQAHYIVAFKSPRDKLGLKNLLLQAFPNRWKDDTIRYDTTLFNYAGHTQQKLVSRWGVGKHVRISYVCMDVLKINIFIYILHRISAIKQKAWKARRQVYV